MSEPEASDPLNVLVVEDNAQISSFLVKGLRAHGFRAECVATGTEAIARLSRGGIDLHLLDLGLPDLDGLDVLRQLRDGGIDVPTVIVTARTDPRDRAAARALGVDRYLTKPFAWAELVSAVRTTLGLPTG